ncbi:MAG: hypothetical protein HY471_00925 [Candidatus Sungbacteria bacterium]|nr:hypothetical protein [Candidatus Sungbacteria bacterium]
MRRKDDELKLNQNTTSLLIFMESYNKSLPSGFSPVSAKELKEFQASRPSLFRNKDEWSIDKHRKRLMDWLSSHRLTP